MADIRALPTLTGDALIQAQIDEAWAAHEGERDPGISDLEWQTNTARTFMAEFDAGPTAGGELRNRQPEVVVDKERRVA